MTSLDCSSSCTELACTHLKTKLEDGVRNATTHHYVCSRKQGLCNHFPVHRASSVLAPVEGPADQKKNSLDH